MSHTLYRETTEVVGQEYCAGAVTALERLVDVTEGITDAQGALGFLMKLEDVLYESMGKISYYFICDSNCS